MFAGAPREVAAYGLEPCAILLAYDIICLMVSPILFPARLVSGAFLLLVAAGVAHADSREDFFESRVRPLLTANCYACHTDSKLGGLRLDSRDSILLGGSSGPALIPGEPSRSLLVEAVRHTHKRLKMPPSGKLKDEQIADLSRWIADGAVWPKAVATVQPEKGFRPDQRAFWAFQPLQNPATPVTKNQTWGKGPIDSYILAALERQQMPPASQAAPAALIRRATFDLIGLPPTPKDVDEFVKDPSPTAFAKAVDRLLASPHFGERWGRYWLDVSAYGEDDARGGGAAKYPNAWRYRDWVVNAFNDDMPYDLFVKAQIAGDLLEEPKERKLKPGLGYFALGPWGYELAAPAVARANERDARIDALTRGFLGLTVACARCHDHKYDPITAKDYYALAGVFASSGYREYPLASAAQIEAYERGQETLREKKRQLDGFLDAFRNQLLDVLTFQIADYLMGARDAGSPGAKTNLVAAKYKLNEDLLKRWIAYLKSDQPKEHQFLDEWTGLTARDADEKALRNAAADFQRTMMAIRAEKKDIDQFNQSLLLVAKTRKAAQKPIAPNGYMGFDASESQQEGKSLNIRKFLVWSDLYTPKPPPFGVENRAIGILNFEGEDLDQFMPPAWKVYADSLRAEVEKAKKGAPKQYPFLMGFEEGDEVKNVNLNLRGNPYNLGDEVPRRFPSILCEGEPAPFRQGSGRVELAQAIVDHPLAARVMANRVWQRLLGFGIVRSASNFGQVGDRPTHPELLDYLAARLKRNWSVKTLIREVMLSSTYQMSTRGESANGAKDPENKLLWRAHARRLDAEALRDSLLAVSGRLDLKMGGPAGELTTENRRRTLYANISRYQLEEQLALFDFPSPNHSSESRESTNVPLQRLFYLNSPFVLANATAFVERLQTEAGSNDSERIRRAYLLLYGRAPAESELKAGLEFLAAPVREANGKTTPWDRYAQVLLASNEASYLE